MQEELAIFLAKLLVVPAFPLRGFLRNGEVIRRFGGATSCSVSFSTFHSALPVAIVI